MLNGMLEDTILALEFTNFCNCSCIMCTQSQMKGMKGFLSQQVFDRLLKNIVDHDMVFDKLIPFGLGESTLHPQFFEFMEKIFVMNSTNRYFKTIDLHTNAINLNENMLELMVKHADQLSTISFSVDACNENTYFNVRKNRNFKDVVKNINRLLELRGKNKLPRITIQFIVMDENKDEAREFLDLWSEIFRKNFVDFQVNYDWYPPMEKDTIFFKRLNPVKFEELAKYEKLHFDVVNSLGLIEKTEKTVETENIEEKKCAVTSTEYRGEKRRYPCAGPFKYVTVSWNGDVTVCCIDTLRELKLGNISQSSLFDIWMSEKAHNYRLCHIKGDLSQMEKCQRCNNLDSPLISKKELGKYLKKYGYKEYLKYIEEL